VLGPSGKYYITKTPIVIGRASECDIILNIAQISRNHSQIYQEDDHYIMEDLGSVNGTCVNDVSIKKHQLNDGDIIALGDVSIVFHDNLAPRILLTDDFGTDTSLTFAVPISELAPLTTQRQAEVKRDPSEMLQIIFDAAKTLLGFQDLKQVLSGVMDLVFEYLKADRGFLMLYDQDADQLEPQVIKYSSSTSPENINFSRTIVNQVFQEGISILTTDAMKDARFDSRESIVMHQIRSCMCVPLWNKVWGEDWNLSCNFPGKGVGWRCGQYEYESAEWCVLSPDPTESNRCQENRRRWIFHH